MKAKLRRDTHPNSHSGLKGGYIASRIKQTKKKQFKKYTDAKPGLKEKLKGLLLDKRY